MTRKLMGPGDACKVEKDSIAREGGAGVRRGIKGWEL